MQNEKQTINQLNSINCESVLTVYLIHNHIILRIKKQKNGQFSN